MGIITGRTRSDAEAIRFMKQALELDPNFAIAYAGLAVSYGNLGQATPSTENATPRLPVGVESAVCTCNSRDGDGTH